MTRDGIYCEQFDIKRSERCDPKCGCTRVTSVVGYDVASLPHRLRTKAAMIRLGESIRMHSECDVMEEAASEIEVLIQQIHQHEQFKGTKP